MSEGLDLFGGHAIEDIPEGYNLEKGVYTETELDEAKVFKSKAGPHGIGFNFKDTSDEGFGLTAFQWLGIPAAPDKAQYLLRDLKAVGLSGEQLVRIAGFVSGSDPETAEVNIEGINDVLSEVKGVMGTTTITEYRKKNGETGQNVSFKMNEEAPRASSSYVDSGNSFAEEQAPADTSNWFGK